MLNALDSYCDTQGTFSPRALIWWGERTREPLAAFACGSKPSHRTFASSLCLIRPIGRIRPIPPTQNQKSSFIAIFPFKAIQRYSKAFKAIQAIFETIFLFYGLHREVGPRLWEPRTGKMVAREDHPSEGCGRLRKPFCRGGGGFIALWQNIQKSGGSDRFPTTSDRIFYEFKTQNSTLSHDRPPILDAVSRRRRAKAETRNTHPLFLFNFAFLIFNLKPPQRSCRAEVSERRQINVSTPGPQAIKSSCSFNPSAAEYGMAGTGNKLNSLRPNRFEGERIMLALAISIFVHVLLFGGYELNKEIRLIPKLPRWLAATQQPARVQQEQPLEFVTVPNPSTEAPKEAKYYSNKNSVAANPDATKDTNKPKLNGTQTDVPETIDESRFQPSKSLTGADQHQPNSSQETQPQAQPRPSLSAGDLTLGKPDNTTEQEQPRPRTLKEAYAEMAKHMPSMTMKQDGGVFRHDAKSSLDVKLTGYGNYDDQMIDTIKQNWFNRIYDPKFPSHGPGIVELDFDMDFTGRISNMTVGKRTNAGYILVYVCQQALLDGAPYGQWSQEMMRTLGTSRPMEFTFFYE